MPNRNGSVYGLTILSPILDEERATPSHDLQIRNYLATLPAGAQSPFALARGTHLCRLVVMDDVIYVGMPACEEHLKSKYLIFECNFDCGLGRDGEDDLDGYLRGLAESVPKQLDAVWGHCVGYPGARHMEAFLRYMKACQLQTTFFFAAVNNRTVEQSLIALRTQRAVAEFLATHQGRNGGMAAEQLQREFLAFSARLRALAPPAPGVGLGDGSWR